jgi:type VI secretion system protein ImpE
MSAVELLRDGLLDQALAAATADVRSAPTDRGKRWLLCQILYFTGDLERADVQLQVVAEQDVGSVETVQLHRQLLRGESARRQVFSAGRAPRFFGGDDPQLRASAEALVHLRSSSGSSNGASEASRILADAERQRVALSGNHLGRPFADFRDLDDVTARFFEVTTADGEYQWLPMSAVKEATFHPPTRPFDLVWRRGVVTLWDGSRGQLYFHGLYPGSHEDDRHDIRMGRMTDWLGAPPIVRGRGLRVFLLGDEEVTLPQILSISFSGAESGAGMMAASAASAPATEAPQ